MERTKYGDYHYIILEEDVPIWNQNGITNRTQKGYSYSIFYKDEAEIDSQEWYFSAMECEDAVQDHIDRLTEENKMNWDPGIEDMIQLGKLWRCPRCNYMSNVENEHYDVGCVNCVKNPHDEALKKMEPFMQVITDLNIAIDSLVYSRQRLVEAMCELSDYPKIIIDSLIKKGVHNG